MDVAQAEYESFSRNHRVVQAQQATPITQLRLVHDCAPHAARGCRGTTLEEALMTPRFLGEGSATPMAAAT